MIVFLALTLAAPPASSETQGRAGAVLLEAGALASRGQWKAASQRLEAIPEGKRTGTVLASIAVAGLAHGQRGRPTKLLQSALEADSTLAEAHFWLGIALIREGSPERALAPLNAAVSLRPRRADYRLARALAGRATPQAVSDIIAASRISPNLFEPRYFPDERRGMLHLAESALRGFPVRREVDEAMGRLLFDAGLFREAGERLAGAQGPTAHELLGRLALRKGDADAAADLLAKATSGASAPPSAWFHLGKAAYQQGNKAKALAALERASRLDSTATLTQESLGLLFLEQGDLDRAELAFEYAIAQGGSPEAPLGLGRVHELRGDLDAALRRYEEAVAMAPASLGALERLARLLERTSKAARAGKVRKQLSRAKQLEKRFSSKLAEARELTKGHEQWCRKLTPDLAERSPGGGLAESFARAGVLARAGEDRRARQEAQKVLRSLSARRWSAGTPPILRMRGKIAGAIVVRAAILDFVAF